MIKKSKVAGTLEKQADAILEEMTALLAQRGIHGLQVVSFAVAEPEIKPMAMADGTPCPVKCVVLPDGRVRCEPQC